MTNPTHTDIQSSTTVYWNPKSDSKPAKAKLVNIDGFLDQELNKIEVHLEDTEQTVGRDESNSVCVPYRKISRRHLRIFPESGQWVVEDLDSTNGMLVNGKNIKSATLNHGDVIKIGSLSFLFQVEEHLSPSSQYSELSETIPSGDVTTIGLPESKQFSREDEQTLVRPNSTSYDNRPRKSALFSSEKYRSILIIILIMVSLFVAFTILRVLGLI